MATREYRIVYVVDEAAALQGIGRMTTALTALDALVDKVGRSIGRLGKNFDAQTFRQNLQAVQQAFDQIERNADKATVSVNRSHKAIEAHGGNTSNLESATRKFEDLAATLSTVIQRSGLAQSQLSQVGSGVRLPGGSGGGSGGGRTGGMISGLGASLTRRTVFAAGASAVRSVREGSQAQSDYSRDSAATLNDFRAELQEVANLRGDKSVTSETISDQLAFMRKTGMNADEAIRFREQYMGAIASGKARGNIDDKTAAELEIQAAQFAQRYNISPETAGKMSGLMGEYGKIPNAEAGAQKMAETAHHLNVLGVGQVGAMMPSLVGLQGDMLDENGGRFGSMESLSARFAATTIRAKSPSTAATQIRQANRALRRFGDDEAGATLEGLGITPEDDYETALRKMSKFITGPDGDLWLKQNGFNNSTERDSLIKQAKLIKVVDAQLGNETADMTPAERAEARRGKAAIARVRREASSQNAGYLQTETGKQRQAENRRFEANIRFGQTTSAFERAKLDAETRLRQQGEIDTPMGNVKDTIGTAFNFGLRSGRDDRLEVEAYAPLREEARRKGIDFDKRFPEYGSVYGENSLSLPKSQFTPADRAKLFNRISAEIEAAPGGGGNGGGAGGNPAQKVAQAGQLLQQAAAQMQKPGAPKAGGPPPGFVAGRP